MKRILFITLITAFVTGLFTSCDNADWEFPDFEHTAVYFAYQSPIRTITLGEDVYDTTLDNEYKAQIMATMGGVYANNTDVVIQIQVDNSLVDGLAFDGNEDPLQDIVAMPENYYSLSSDRITIKKGDILGGVTVQLTEAFFADPLALTTHYVIPVVMTSVTNADSILQGVPLVENPRRGVADDWEVQPKDYILYAIKYINKYDANYLRRGQDVISGDQSGTITRSAEYVEWDEVVSTISTRSLNTIAWEHQSRDLDDFSRSCVLLLTFDDQGNCVITSDTDGITASGTGTFVSKGEKNSWGNKDRDALYLEYTIDYGDVQFTITDTMVVRDRGVKPEWFTSVLK
ncbi:DUF5627 domain-containing protein [Alkalitalea saponilacus]|uniref:DUF1735 domain-containing protein n=1 Tax=Alkalitalea saponilacus TaxID=889453 RepID=A0A1T5A9F1_9BACT|nr:DUF5627 domain-containing protein [Alkalitalea saponilacus]ASB48787.1 adhesin [Alkalitalea saponilacus]SKB31489.1 protein of unknown function [Alkalitalea saponilacus]